MDLKSRFQQALQNDTVEQLVAEVVREHLRTEYAYLVMDVRHGKKIKDAKSGEFVTHQTLSDYLIG